MDNLPIPEHERIGLVGAQTTGPDTPKVIGGAGGTSPVMGDAGADLLAEMEGKPPTSLDDDYRAVLEERNSDDNLKWLEDQVGPLVDEPPAEPEGAGIMDTAGKVAKDIGGGLMEAPKQAVGGAISAVNEAWDLIDQAATWLNQNVADTRLGTLTGEQMAPPQAGQVGELPNVGAPETVTGGFVRGISQFLTGFAGAGKVTGIKNSLPGVFGKSMIADFAAFDGQEANLANFIQQFPTLQNPVTEFLATDQETPEMIGRMKNALTGLGAGAALEPFVQVLRAFRAARKAKELSGEADYASAAKKLAEAGPDDPTLGANPQTGERIRQALGDPDAPLVQVQEEIFPTGDAYAAKALDKTTGAHSRFPMDEAAEAPPPADGMVRMYHGGNPPEDADKLWFSTDRKYAEGYAAKSGGQVYYVDVPATSKWVNDPFWPDQGVKDGFTFSHELPPELTRTRKALHAAKALDKTTGGEAGAADAGIQQTPPRSISRDPLRQTLAEADQEYRDTFANAVKKQDFSLLEPAKAKERAARKQIRDAVERRAQAVRDTLDEGEELVYHGTGTEFDEFDAVAARSGNGSSARVGSDVVFVTPKYEFADSFAGPKGDVKELVLGRGKFFSAENEADMAALEPFISQQPNADALRAKIMAGETGQLQDSWGVLESPEIVAELKRLGYDGVRMIENFDDYAGRKRTAPTLAVWNAEKLRYASGNKFWGGDLPSLPPRQAPPAKALDKTTGGGAAVRSTSGGGAMQPPSAPPGATGASPPQGPPPGGARLDFGPRQVYVNLARINSTDDVKAVVTQMADAFGDDIAKAQRGVRSNATTMAAAGDENAWQILEGKRKADAPKVATAEEQLVLRNLWAQSAETLKGLAKVAADGGPEDLVAFRRAVETHRMIQNTVVGIRTETARALQQWRIPAGGSKEMERQLADVLANTGGEAASRDMAAKVAALADHPNGGPALESFVDRLGRGAQLTVDVVREYWINSILSGPKTHAVNMMSNAAVFFQSLGERALAGQMGDLVNPVYGVKPGEASAMLYGALEAQKDAWRAAAHALKTGETGMGRSKTLESSRRRAMSAESFGVSSDSMLGRGLDYAGGFVNIPGRMLTAADDYFKMVNYRAQIHALALREASTEIERGMLPREGLKARIAELVDDPPERFRLMANDYAAYNTFTNEAGPVAKAAMKVRDTVPGGWLAMPFINTPANLFTYAFERSPAALMMKNRFWAEVQAGGARRDMALAKMGLGTMAFTAAFDLAVNGHITGGGPSGDKAAGERQARARAGWQPYSIRVQTGTEADGSPTYRYFAYNRFDPVGTLFANAADLGEYFLNSSDGRIDTRDAAELAAMMVFGTAENLKDKAFFRGFADAVAAINNPERYGERWLQNAIGGFVPTIVKDAARAMDPVSRETTDLVSALKNRTPGLSADLPPRLDFWGKPMQFQSGLGTAYDILSPVYSRSTAGKMDPAEKAFFELKYFPTHPSSIQIGGQYVSLRNMPEVENRLIELTNAKASDLVAENTEAMMEQKGGGRAALRRLEAHGNSTLREALNATVSSPEFAAADPEERQDMMSDVLSDYRRAAKLQVLREFPRLQDIRDSIPPRGTGAQLPY